MKLNQAQIKSLYTTLKGTPSLSPDTATRNSNANLIKEHTHPVGALNALHYLLEKKAFDGAHDQTIFNQIMAAERPMVAAREYVTSKENPSENIKRQSPLQASTMFASEDDQDFELLDDEQVSRAAPSWCSMM